MKITLVVDGYNAINAIPETKAKLEKDLYSARRAILAICREYARSSGYITDVKVVFDGRNRYRYLDVLNGARRQDQIFSSTGGGDDKIIATVKIYSSKGRVVLASNDNYVRNNARAYGASIINSEELAPKRKEKTINAADADKGLDRNLKDDITREYREELGL